MKNLIKLLILLSMGMVFSYADKNESIGTYCFESPYISIYGGTKVDKVVLHFEDFNHSREEGGSTVRMFYFLENDTRRYSVPHLYMYYNKKNNIYHGGVERDGGGELEFNATSNRLRMDKILLYGATIDLIMPYSEPVKLDDSLEDIVKISDVLHGSMSIKFLGKDKQMDYSKEKLWITGKKCTGTEDIKGSKIFYTEKEYMETLKTTKKEDEYIHLFDEDFIEREDIASPIETIQLKKSYTSIADMMNGEGFDFEWMKSYKINFFLHNNKRAFIHVDNDATIGCFSVGYYLLELNQNILKKMDFGWESGSISTPIIFKPEPVVVPIVTVISTEGKEWRK